MCGPCLQLVHTSSHACAFFLAGNFFGNLWIHSPYGQKTLEQLQNTRPLHLHVSVCFEERGIFKVELYKSKAFPRLT